MQATLFRKTILGLFSALILCVCGLFVLAQTSASIPDSSRQNWTNYVRIGADSLKGGDANEIAERAQASDVFGIEVDNDIPGRYESFVHPQEKLRAIRAVAEAAHKVGNQAFVYIAGTECIMAHGDKVAHTLAKDNPTGCTGRLRESRQFSEAGRRSGFGPGMRTWGESVCHGMAQDLHGARAADCAPGWLLSA